MVGSFSDPGVIRRVSFRRFIEIKCAYRVYVEVKTIKRGGVTRNSLSSSGLDLRYSEDPCIPRDVTKGQKCRAF